jgi:HTH-type transcriptional regulator/antitoxin HigA
MKIENTTQYKSALVRVENIMQKGSQLLTSSDAEELSNLTTALNAYEEITFPLPKPQSLQTMIEWKMFERRLKQKDLAALLDEPDSRISEMMSGKRGINLKMAKKLFKLLDIPADFILEHA